MTSPVLLTAALLALAGLAAAGPADPVLAKVRARYRTITAMSAQVSEVMCSAATGTCKRFTGKAEMKRPSKLRLEIDQPERQLVVCDGRVLTMYLAKEKQAYRFDMARSDQMLTLLNPLDGLLDGEVVRSEAGDGVHTLALAVAKLKDSFKEIVLTVDAKT
ncbi:MAG: outer membrane lipoprotein carrier protein LolA, partial [Candidatus Edwardsbacteria bacterium]|nr:outer membrane lipoprotein carrier protein LolA [Candidatus Edwardsbacteria bacterium]